MCKWPFTPKITRTCTKYWNYYESYIVQGDFKLEQFLACWVWNCWCWIQNEGVNLKWHKLSSKLNLWIWKFSIHLPIPTFFDRPIQNWCIGLVLFDFLLVCFIFFPYFPWFLALNLFLQGQISYFPSFQLPFSFFFLVFAQISCISFTWFLSFFHKSSIFLLSMFEPFFHLGYWVCLNFILSTLPSHLLTQDSMLVPILEC